MVMRGVQTARVQWINRRLVRDVREGHREDAVVEHKFLLYIYQMLKRTIPDLEWERVCPDYLEDAELAVRPLGNFF